MCFFLEQDSKRLIAPEGGIECFKIVCPTNTPGVYSSLYHGFLYQESKQCPEVPLVVEKDLSIIQAGYHSYCSFEACQQYRKYFRYSDWYVSTVIVRCLIPAGSQYYKDPIHYEYVSSSIIILGEES